MKAKYVYYCILFVACMLPLHAADAFFPVPKGYERWVPFWTTIFTAYESHQMVICDARCPEAIYAAIEIKDKHSKKSIFQKKELQKEDEQKNAIEVLSSLLDKDLEITFLQTMDNLNSIYKKCGLNEPISWNDLRLKLQRGNRDKIKYGIIRYGLYKNQIERIFKEKNLPPELSLLPLIESNYWMFARSSAGALGVWQFMPGTGKKYLTINKYIDERLDPIKSTYAAAQYLSQAYAALGSWDVTVTSYNYGNLGMIRAVNTLKTNDLSIILQKYRSRSFQYASRNFYLEFLAMKHIMTNLNKYFPEIQMLPPFEYKTLTIQHRTTINNLLHTLKIDPIVFKIYNPSFKEEAYRKNIIVPLHTEIYLPPDVSKETKPIILGIHPTNADEISDDLIKQLKMTKDTLIALNAINEESFAKRDKYYMVIIK